MNPGHIPFLHFDLYALLGSRVQIIEIGLYVVKCTMSTSECEQCYVSEIEGCHPMLT